MLQALCREYKTSSPDEFAIKGRHVTAAGVFQWRRGQATSAPCILLVSDDANRGGCCCWQKDLFQSGQFGNLARAAPRIIEKVRLKGTFRGLD